MSWFASYKQKFFSFGLFIVFSCSFTSIEASAQIFERVAALSYDEGKPLGPTVQPWPAYTDRVFETPVTKLNAGRYLVEPGLADVNCISLKDLSSKGDYLILEDSNSHPRNIVLTNNITTYEAKSRATFCFEGRHLVTHSGSFTLIGWDVLGYLRFRATSGGLTSAMYPIELSFQDTYTIVPSYTWANETEKLLLTGNDANGATFTPYDFLQAEDHQPDNAAWHFNYIDGKALFTIQNSKTGEFLAKKEGSVELELIHTIGDNETLAHWRIDVIDAGGDHILVNESSTGVEGELYVLSIESNSPVLKLLNRPLPQLAGLSSNSLDRSMMFRVNERSVHMKLLPEDIVANNSLMHLYNGLLVNDLLVTSSHQQGWNIRRHKISIEDWHSDYTYTFVSGINPDQVRWSDSNSLEEHIAKFPLFKDSKYDPSVVAASIRSQLASPNAGSIVWLTDLDSIPDDTFTYIEDSGKTLRVLSRVIEDNLSTQNFGFLLKRSDNTFTIDDPTRPIIPD
ncbi:hypothetical protein [Microbulbifer variabilis]|uniref:hypothetical protein n=1 Tax=Microbulbifer variabilis TaxID=266805 RepID=UPI001CFDDDF5|nr:hypothetical protein [Microbulbifer variabilis]